MLGKLNLLSIHPLLFSQLIFHHHNKEIRQLLLTNIEDEIRLLCTSNDKDTHQAEEEDAENAFLEDISQELSVKEAVWKLLNSAGLHLL